MALRSMIFSYFSETSSSPRIRNEFWYLFRAFHVSWSFCSNGMAFYSALTLAWSTAFRLTGLAIPRLFGRKYGFDPLLGRLWFNISSTAYHYSGHTTSPYNSPRFFKTGTPQFFLIFYKVRPWAASDSFWLISMSKLWLDNSIQAHVTLAGMR